MNRTTFTLLLLTSLTLAAGPAGPPILGDYDAEPRVPGGAHVDSARLVRRLQDLHANTYLWLIWHNANDWEDLQAFLPLARTAGISVWAYLVPHSETGADGGAYPYSEPFRLDYVRWAAEIARLSLTHENLVGYVIDDFWANVRPKRFSPDYIRQMVQVGKSVNPRLRFYPLLYFPELGEEFAQRLAPLIDGVVAAYPRERRNVEAVLPFLNDTYHVLGSAVVAFPAETPSQAGEHGFVSQQAKVTDPAQAAVTFHYQDRFDGPTDGYHFLQCRVDDTVVWEEDVAGKDDGEVTVALTTAVAGKPTVRLGFGVCDRKGVSQFPLRAVFSNLRVTGLELSTCDLGRSDAWSTTTTGAFQGEHHGQVQGQQRFRLPLIIMTCGSRGEWRHRYRSEPTPDLIAAEARLALELVAEGKAEGVVTYCLDKGEGSPDLTAVAAEFARFQAGR